MNKLLAMIAALAFSAAGASAAIDIQEVQSPMGIKAWLVEDHTIPFVAIKILFRGGTGIEPEDKQGGTYLMTGLLEEGAGEFDAAEFQKRQETLAASFGFDSSKEAVSISAKFLTENRDESVELLRIALQEPRFDEEPLERVQAQVLAIIADQSKDPDDIAGDQFNELFFGDHPYGKSREGTAESVSALTRDDLVQIHKRALSLEHAVVGAAGDITPEELGALLDDLLGGLPASGAPLPDAPEITLDGGVTVVDFPTPQSVAQFGHKGLLRDDPDFLAAYLLNEIFGGSGMTSRIFTAVRKERGLTYGAYAYLAAFRDLGMVLGYVASANETMAEAIEVVRDEWRKIATDGITQEELDAAKKYLTGAYPLRFDGNSSIARILAGMQFDYFPIDYVNNRNDMVMALTLEDVNQVARRLYLPDKLHFVIVGQPSGIEGEAE